MEETAQMEWEAIAPDEGPILSRGGFSFTLSEVVEILNELQGIANEWRERKAMDGNNLPS